MECANCARVGATRLCANCTCLAYCGDECARQDWPRHWTEVHAAPSIRIGANAGDDEEHDVDEIPLGPAGGPGRLYVGGLRALLHLDEYAVGAIITVIPKHRRYVNEERLRTFVGNRAHMRIPWHDVPEQHLSFKKLCKAAHFIQEHRARGHSVLVHCAAGRSRSVSVILFYMTHAPEWAGRWKSVEEALDHIQRVRPSAGPNDGFIAQLKKYVTRRC